MKITLRKDEKSSVDKVLNFIKSLNSNEKNEFDSFMAGFNSASQMYKEQRKEVN